MPSTPRLSIQKFAQIRACRSLKDAPIAPPAEAESLDEPAWQLEEEAWLAQLADEVDAGDLTNVRAYDDAFAAAALERTGIAVDPLPGEPLNEPVPPLYAEPREQKATFQHEKAPSATTAPIPPPPVSPDETAAIDTRKLVEGLRLPFAASSSTSFVPKPAAPKTEDEFGDTALIPFARTESSGPDPVDSIGTYVDVVVGLGFAEDKTAFLASRGLTAASWVTSSRGWADRLRADPDLAKAYDELLPKALKRHAR